MFFFVMYYHVSSYCDHYCYLYTCDSCVLWSITHHYECYAISHFSNKQHWVCMMWICHTVNSEAHTVRVWLASPLCHGTSNFSPRCHMPTMPWVLHRLVSLSEVSLPLVHMSYVGVFGVVCFLSQVPMWLPCSPKGVNHWGLQHCSPSKYTLGRYMCTLDMVCSLCQECTR